MLVLLLEPKDVMAEIQYKRLTTPANTESSLGMSTNINKFKATVNMTKPKHYLKIITTPILKITMFNKLKLLLVNNL